MKMRLQNGTSQVSEGQVRDDDFIFGLSECVRIFFLLAKKKLLNNNFFFFILEFRGRWNI